MANEKAVKNERPELEIRTRTPKKPGIFDGVGTNRQGGQHPLRDILSQEPASDTSTPSSPTSGITSTPSIARTSSNTRAARTSSTPSDTTDTSRPIAPVSDFSRKPNSEARDAIPAGYYEWSRSKEVYDVLYALTRGSFPPPKRKIQISRTELMKRANVGSKVTIDKILTSLCENGLLQIEFRYGQHGGNVIDVRDYDEAKAAKPDWVSSRTSTTRLPSTPRLTQNLGNLDNTESRLPSTPQVPINIEPDAAPNTLFKDFLNLDDERAVAEAVERFYQAAVAKTGTGRSKGNIEGLAGIIDAATEAIDAAAQDTRIVSVYGKFGLAHMKRLMLVSGKGKSTGRVKYFDPGKSEAEDDPDYAPKALTEEQRQDELENLRRIQTSDNPHHVEWHRTLFTADDWNWLMERIENGD